MNEELRKIEALKSRIVDLEARMNVIDLNISEIARFLVRKEKRGEGVGERG